MKIIKKIFIGLLVLIIINLIGLLALSFNLKKILVNGVIKEVIITEIKKEADTSNETTNKEQMIKLFKSKEAEELINKYLNLTVECILDEKNTCEVDLEQDAIEFIEEHREKLEKAIGEEITDEQIEEAKKEFASKDMSKEYKQSINNARNSLKPEEKSFLAGYKIFVSSSFRIIIISLIILNIILIAILQKSLHKWIPKLSIALIVNGIFLTIISFGIKLLVENTTELETFNINNLLTTGVILFVIGIISLIIYKIIFRKKDKQMEVQNDLSKPSQEQI